MKRLIIAIVLMSLSVPMRSQANALPLMNLYMGYQMTDASTERLAKWDYIILDMDQTYHFPEQIKKIKALNPRAKLLAYVSTGEIAESRGRVGRGSPGQMLYESIPDSWYLTRPGVKRLTWWPGAFLLNASDKAPMVNGKRWNTYLGTFIREQLMSKGVWDGVFLDTSYDEVTSKFGVGIDIDNDGRSDDPKIVDDEYKKGMRILIQNIVDAVGPTKFVMVNSSISYADITNGVLFENFPQYGWQIPFYQMKDVLTKNTKPAISAYNVNTQGKDTPNDYRLMRFGLASSLVAGAYYSFDKGPWSHHETWWYDEYEAPIGTPSKQPQQVNGLWVRAYTRGFVLVNPTKKAITYSLDGQYEKLTGTQDRLVNSGELVRSVTIGPEDGLLLLRRENEGIDLEQAVLQNGQFYQVLDSKGQKKRQGFFAIDKRVPSGANYTSVDIDRDGRVDLVYTSKGKLNISYGKGGTKSITPYLGFTGSIDFVTGQTDRDTPLEIVTVPSSGFTSTIRVFQHDLTAGAQWDAYRKEFKGGASVTLGDWDGDGLREIVVAAGQGGGPHIRSFKTDGKNWRGSFFAYPAEQRGGAFLSLGDSDGDGRAELFAGSGIGVAPSIRQYDADQKLLTSIQLTDGSKSVPLRLKTVDIDQDGKVEVLIPSSAF